MKKLLPILGRLQKQLIAPASTFVTFQITLGLMLLSQVVSAQCYTAGITPVAGNDAGFTTCYGSKITIPFSQLLANDVEPANASFSIVDFTNPSGIDVRQVGNSFEIDPKDKSGYITFTYTIKKNDGYYFFNGHYYKWESGNTKWADAKALASLLTYNGRQGYLATITSSQENDFLKNIAPVNGWIGASDVTNPGTWRWVTGPEGQALGGIGQAASYKKWASLEPLDPTSTNKKNYASFGAGSWFTNDNKAILAGGYLVEYGGMETECAPELLSTATVTIYVSPKLTLNATTTSTCPGGNVGAVNLMPSGGTQPYSYEYFTHSFSGNTLDANMFTTTFGNYSVNGQLDCQSTYTYSQYQNSIVTNKAYADMGFLRLEGSFKMQDNANVIFGLTPANVPLMNNYTMPISINFNAGFINTMVAGSSSNAGAYDAGVWYDVKIEKKGNAVSFFSRKTGESYWTQIGGGIYNGLEGAYAVGSQYYNLGDGDRGYCSKNWKLSFNPDVTNLAKGEYYYTVIDAIGCRVTEKFSVENTNFSVQAAPTYTSAINVCDGTVGLFSATNPISTITTKTFSSDFSGSYNASLYTTLGAFVAVSNSEVRGNKALDQSLWKNSFVTSYTATDAGYICFNTSVKFEANTRAYIGFATTLRAIQNEWDLPISFSYKNGSLFYNINGVPVMIAGAYPAGTYYDLKIEKSGRLVKFFIRKGSEEFKMVGMDNYYGNESTFRFGMQYYGQAGAYGAIFSKNWVVTETAKLANICAGNYVYSVTTAGGCTADVPFTIFEPITFTNAAVVSPTCFGYGDGKITISAQGGKTSYQYSINGGTSFTSNATISNLSAGTYPVVIKDAFGTLSAPVNIEVSQPAKVKAEISAAGPTNICIGQSAALSAVTEAVAPTFKWSNNTTTQTANISKTGIYTVKVTDAAGCYSTSDTMSVTVHELPVTSLTFSPETNACTGFTMTGQTTGIPGTYEWYYGTTPKATGKSLTLWPSDPDGLYSAYAVNPYGCKSVLPATYAYVNKNLEVSYALVGIKAVTINEGAVVTSGSVGVTSASGKATFQKNTSVAGAGAFVRAKSISVGKPVNIPVQIKTVPPITLPDMLYNNTVLTGVNIQQKVDGVLNGNYKDVTIKNGSRVIITGSVFGKVQIEDNCEVTFTNTDLNMDELTIKNNNDPKATIVHFAANTDLKIRGNVLIEQNCQINPEEVRLNIFVGTVSGNSLTFEVKGYGTDVRASVYVPVGQIKLTTDDVYGGQMKGLYIGETIISSGKKAVWSAYSCDVSGNLVYSSRSQANPMMLQAETATAMKVNVFPNPSSTEFQLAVKSDEKTAVTVTIVDATGKVVERIIDTRLNSNLRVGANLRPGVYFAQVVQGNQKQTIKLLKL